MKYRRLTAVPLSGGLCAGSFFPGMFLKTPSVVEKAMVVNLMLPTPLFYGKAAIAAFQKQKIPLVI